MSGTITRTLFVGCRMRAPLAADAEWPLRAGPDGELAVRPFRDRGARFQRCVGDVGDCVRRRHRLVGGLDAGVDRTLSLRSSAAPASLAAAAAPLLLQVLKQVLRGDLRRLPFGLDGPRASSASCSVAAATPTSAGPATPPRPGIPAPARVSRTCSASRSSARRSTSASGTRTPRPRRRGTRPAPAPAASRRSRHARTSRRTRWLKSCPASAWCTGTRTGPTRS